MNELSGESRRGRRDRPLARRPLLLLWAGLNVIAVPIVLIGDPPSSIAAWVALLAWELVFVTLLLAAWASRGT